MLLLLRLRFSRVRGEPDIIAAIRPEKASAEAFRLLAGLVRNGRDWAAQWLLVRRSKGSALLKHKTARFTPLAGAGAAADR
jgi:hypothetical protein